MPYAAEINIRLDADIKFDKEISMHVAHAPIFGVYSQGETEDRAKHNLEDAVQGFLSVAYSRGLLKRSL